MNLHAIKVCYFGIHYFNIHFKKSGQYRLLFFLYMFRVIYLPYMLFPMGHENVNIEMKNKVG